MMPKFVTGLAHSLLAQMCTKQSVLQEAKSKQMDFVWRWRNDIIINDILHGKQATPSACQTTPIMSYPVQASNSIDNHHPSRTLYVPFLKFTNIDYFMPQQPLNVRAAKVNRW